MNKVRSSAILISFIFLIIFICGCVNSETTVQKSIPPMPEQTIEQIIEQKTISLQTAISVLQMNPRYYSNKSSYGICYIRGINVLKNGTAGEWTIGVSQGNSSFFFIYDGDTESIIEWPDALPYDQIQPDQLVYPDVLFSNRPTMINDITDAGRITISELELIDGLYIISAQSRQYRFNSTNGYEIL